MADTEGRTPSWTTLINSPLSILSLMYNVFAGAQKYLHLVYPAALVYFTPLIYWRFWLRADDCDYYWLALNMFIAFMINNMVLWSYYTCFTSDPGRLPWSAFRDKFAREDVVSYKRWVTKEYDPETLPYEQVNPNECQKCGAIKLTSTHHCSSCGKCVYLMDHHCFWTGNCVGYLTLKPFVLYNLYQSLLMGYQLYMMWLHAQAQGLTHISFGFPDVVKRF